MIDLSNTEFNTNPVEHNRCKFAIIGLGNAFRNDDGIGIYLAQRVAAELENLGVNVDVYIAISDNSELLDVWQDRAKVLVLDAAHDPKQEVGSIYFIDPLLEILQTESVTSLDKFGFSSHLTSLVDALKLGQALNKLPQVMQLIGVVGKNFGYGQTIGSEVLAVVEQLIANSIEFFQHER